MRFMMMVIPKGEESAAPAPVLHAEALAKRTQYNQALQKAGVLLALDSLFPPATGARVVFADGRATVTDRVTDGPVAAGQDVIAGYWILQVRSREEAIEWAKRAPLADHEVIEVRQLHELPGYSSGYSPDYLADYLADHLADYSPGYPADGPKVAAGSAPRNAAVE